MIIVKPDPEDFLLDSYNFPLPPERIAQFPPQERGASRLMLLRGNCRGDDPDNNQSNIQGNCQPRHHAFASLPSLLPPNSLLIANNSRVVPARLPGFRQSGGHAEFLLLTPLELVEAQNLGNDSFKAKVSGLIRPAGKIRIGDILHFPGNLTLEIAAKGQFGQCEGVLAWQGELKQILNTVGLLPLPPYIRRQPQKSDLERYQTIYATRAGSVAAPTAGLHFTASLRQELQADGHEWLEVSLHVGYGTFSPVRCGDIRQHQMHAEYVEISEEAASRIERARQEKRPIIAVGTTSLRTIEGVAQKRGRVEAYKGPINLFLYPGQPIRVASGIITNFHLPCSTLLMLVAAFTGRRHILAAYNEAVAAGYRFFSYGDAMLII